MSEANTPVTPASTTPCCCSTAQPQPAATPAAQPQGQPAAAPAPAAPKGKRGSRKR